MQLSQPSQSGTNPQHTPTNLYTPHLALSTSATVVHLPVGKGWLKLVSVLPPTGSLPDLLGVGHGAHLGAGQRRCQGACPVQQLRVGSCPAMQWKMVLGVQETVGNKAGMVLRGDTVREGVCVALGRITTCNGWRADGISKTQPWLRKPSSQHLRLAADPVPARSGERVTLRGPGLGPAAASSMGKVSDGSPLLGAREGPPGHAGILRRAYRCTSTQSSLAQLSCRNLVHNSSVPALLHYSTWIAP